MDGKAKPELLFDQINYTLALRSIQGRLIALTDRDAPNRRIVEIRPGPNGNHDWRDVVAEIDGLIESWLVAGNHIFVSYRSFSKSTIRVFDLEGQRLNEVCGRSFETVRLVGGSPDSDEIFVETESFTEPPSIYRFAVHTGAKTLWDRRCSILDSWQYTHSEVCLTSRDGTRVPMHLIGRSEVLARKNNPTIVTAYGGFGTAMSPRFSVLAAILIEQGCLFAIPCIRGGSEFGAEWHRGAKRRNRQNAFDDFLMSAEWLIESGMTAPHRLAIFGGSNAGLLVAVALTQRPELFCAVLCIAPLLDMLRYHLFDSAYMWKEEFGTAEDPKDFAALLAYSPYHRLLNGTAYPATMIVSGDADRNCNSLHARKMTARLQAANSSGNPIILDYNHFRGHSPVLPLSERIDALTDRLAFLGERLQIAF